MVVWLSKRDNIHGRLGAKRFGEDGGLHPGGFEHGTSGGEVFVSGKWMEVFGSKEGIAIVNHPRKHHK